MTNATRKNLNSQHAAMLFLIALSLAAISCGEQHFRLTEEQVEERIKKELPVGSTQDQVKQFISSFKTEFEVDEREYEAVVVNALETPAPTHHGIIRARIRKIGRNPKIFALFDLHLEFYFDEKGFFTDHKLKTVGYH